MQLSLAFDTGAAPDKWIRRFTERSSCQLVAYESIDACGKLLAGEADLALVRLPDSRVNDELHRVVLYEEQPQICLPKEHELTLLEAVSSAELAELGVPVLYQAAGKPDVKEVATQVQVVAANVGCVIGPGPLFRAVAGKETVTRPWLGPAETTQMALVWLKAADCPEIQDFVGICKGRTAHSSRSATADKKRPQKAPAAKQKREPQGQKAARNGSRRPAARKRPRR